MNSPGKILALKLRSLGDTVLMTAALKELRKGFPRAEIHAAVLSNWGPLLEHQDYVDRVWNYERHRETASRAKALASLAFRLRKERFDCVLCFHASPSSATLAFATGAPVRSIHFHGHKNKNRYSTVVVPGKGVLKPIIERDMDTVRALGLAVPNGCLPSLTLWEHDRKRVRETLRGRGLGGSILGIGIGSSRPTKAWPIEKAAELALEWVRLTGDAGSVLALAGPDERVRLDIFQRELDRRLAAFVSDPLEAKRIAARIHGEHSFSVRELAIVLSELAVFAGNDSGPRHVAVAVGTPTVTVFGPEHPFEWHPYPVDRHPYFFIDNLSCRRDADPGMPAWCGLHDCVVEKHRCMTQIDAQAVLVECLRVAGKGRPAS